MTTETLLKGLGIAFGIYLVTNNQEETKENYFRIKDGSVIPESQMASKGYVKYGGRWVHVDDLAIAAGQAGVTDVTTINPTTPKGLQILNLLQQAGVTITTSIINNTKQAKEDLILQIVIKYMTAGSPNYNANFTHTVAQLNTYTLTKLKDILENGQ